MINKPKLKLEFSRNVLTLMTGTTIAEFYTSVKNIERWIKKLKDENKIEFIGASKTGGYVVK